MQKALTPHAFIVEMIGRRPIRFIEPATMKKQFAIANSIAEATRFDTAEQATIRARQEMSPSTFNVREVSSVGGWHFVAGAEEREKQATISKLGNALAATANPRNGKAAKR